RGFVRLGLRRRLEHRSGLAGIGIKPEDEELDGERAEIDQPADQRLRLIRALATLPDYSVFALRCLLRHEQEADRFLDLIDERIEPDDAELTDRGRNPPGHVQAAGSTPRDVEISL